MSDFESLRAPSSRFAYKERPEGAIQSWMRVGDEESNDYCVNVVW